MIEDDGTEFTDAHFDALANSGDARASSAGRSTLKRTAITGSLLPGARGARPELLAELGARDAAAADLDSVLHRSLYPLRLCRSEYIPKVTPSPPPLFKRAHWVPYFDRTIGT